MGHYERLSAQDSSFILWERRETPMHVGAVAILQAGPLGSADGGIDAAAITRHVESRLHLLPRYRQRLVWAPLEAGRPFGRLLKPAEVARACAYLASDESGLMTGSIIDFDQQVLGTGNAIPEPPAASW